MAYNVDVLCYGILCVIALWIKTQALPGREKDYCENQRFSALCTRSSVIVVQSAVYGRMTLGDCIGRDYGYIGCQRSVLREADNACSGRTQCEIPVPYSHFNSSCPQDLKPFLRIAYKCLEVETQPYQRCEGVTSQGLLLLTNHGYLSSKIAKTDKRGTAECPWIIRARVGQTINITLHNYAPVTDICHTYITIREPESAKKVKSTSICSAAQRTKQVYLSQTHLVEIRLLTNNDWHYVVEYNVVGCPALVSDRFTKVKTRGNVATLSCTEDETTWKLRCEGNRWQGQKKNCSQVVSEAELYHSWGIISLPFGVSIALVVIIALVIGLLFLVFGLFGLRWRRHRHHSHGNAHVVAKQNGYYAGFAPQSGAQRPKTLPRYTKRELPVTPRPAAPPETPTPYESENEYSYIADVPPRPAQAAPSAAQEPPKYFELDPEENKRLPQAMVRVNDRYVLSGRTASPIQGISAAGNVSSMPGSYSANCSPRVCMSMGPALVQCPPVSRRVIMPVPYVNSSGGATGQEPDVVSTSSNMPLCERLQDDRHL